MWLLSFPLSLSMLLLSPLLEEPVIRPRSPMGGSSSPDDDPTGVRALLSSLPDPGPMPPELVARIGATLAHEQDLRAGQLAGEVGAVEPVGSPGTTSGTGPAVVPLVRRRPRRGQVLAGIAGAAAAVVVGFVGVNALASGPSQSSASLAAGGARSDATSTGSSAPGERSGAVRQPGRASGGATPSRSAGSLSTPSAGSAVRPSAGAPGSAASGAGALHGGVVAPVRIEMTGTDYRPHSFAAQASALPSSAHLPPPGSGAHQAAGAIGTAAGLRSCLEGLGVSSALGTGSVTADVARYEAAPAAVVVLSVDGKRRAWAVGRDCSAADPHVLHGPVALP